MLEEFAKRYPRIAPIVIGAFGGAALGNVQTLVGGFRLSQSCLSYDVFRFWCWVDSVMVNTLSFSVLSAIFLIFTSWQFCIRLLQFGEISGRKPLLASAALAVYVPTTFFPLF